MLLRTAHIRGFLDFRFCRSMEPENLVVAFEGWNMSLQVKNIVNVLHPTWMLCVKFSVEETSQ